MSVKDAYLNTQFKNFSTQITKFYFKKIITKTYLILHILFNIPKKYLNIWYL